MLKGFPNVARWNQSENLFQSSVIRLQAAKENVQPKLTRRLENLGSLQVRRTLIDLACSYVSSADLGPDDWTPAVSDCCAGEVPAKAQAEDSSVNELLDCAEFHEEVEHLLEELSEVFQLIWYRELDKPDIAELIGVDVRTVQRKWRTARQLLEQSFDLNAVI